MGSPFKLIGNQINRAVPHPRFNLHTCTGTGVQLDAWLLKHCQGGFTYAVVVDSCPRTLMPFHRTASPGEPPLQRWAAARKPMMVIGRGETFADLVDCAKEESDFPTSWWVIFDLQSDADACKAKWGR